MNRTVILASRSPRRARLLHKIVRRFSILAVQEPKMMESCGSARATTLCLARVKARQGAKKRPKCIIISADTLLECRRRVLGQPKNRKDATRMLHLISGHTLRAYTSICVIFENKEISWTETAEVEFKQMDEKALAAYIDSKKWAGKAGGFNIEEKPAAGWARTVDGDPHVVVGLPLRRLKQILASLP